MSSCTNYICTCTWIHNNHSMYINLNSHTWHPLDSESIVCYITFHKDASTHVGVLLCVLRYIESIYKQLRIIWVSLLDICLNMEQFITLSVWLNGFNASPLDGPSIHELVCSNKMKSCLQAKWSLNKLMHLTLEFFME